MSGFDLVEIKVVNWCLGIFVDFVDRYIKEYVEFFKKLGLVE